MRDCSLKGGKAEQDLSWGQPCPKLHIPVIPREFLECPRLRWRFDAALSHKLILVTAPPATARLYFGMAVYDKFGRI